ncbi:MAG: hypothetical protein ABI222_09580 [Opitutaceae bacterium]
MATPPPLPPSVPPQPPSVPPPLPPAAPAKGGNRTLIIVLCVVGGLLLLFGGCVTACGYYAASKARAYAKSAEKNPQFAALSLAAAVNPEIQVVSENEATGVLTLRNKKTGEVVKIDTSKYTAENLSSAFQHMAKESQVQSGRTLSDQEATNGENTAESSAEESISPARAAALAVNAKKFPSYLPVYPGARTTQAQLNSFGGATQLSYVFTTGDAPEVVTDFYEKRFTGAGFTVLSRQNGTDDNGATSAMSLQHAEPPTVVATFNAEIDHGKTKVTIVSTSVPAK